MAASSSRSWFDDTFEDLTCPSASETHSTCASPPEVPRPERTRTRRPISEKTHALNEKTDFCREYGVPIPEVSRNRRTLSKSRASKEKADFCREYGVPIPEEPRTRRPVSKTRASNEKAEFCRIYGVPIPEEPQNRRPISNKTRASNEKTEFCREYGLAISEEAQNRKPISEKTRALFVKTEFCRNYGNGRTCIKGDQCNFAHGDSELRHRPNFTNTTQCHFWASNRCKMGKDCPFAHGEEELRNMYDVAPPVSDQANKPAQEEKLGISAAKSSPNVVSNAASALAPPAKTGPQSSTHCPHCGFLSEIAVARFCAMCGGALVAHTMSDQGSTQPGPSRSQCEKNPDLPAQQRAVEAAPCSTSAMPSMTQVSTPAAVPSMSSWHGASLSPHLVSPGVLAVMPVLMNIAGLSPAMFAPAGAVLHAQAVDAVGARKVDGCMGMQMPGDNGPAGQDPHSFAKMLSTVGQQQVYED